MNKELSDFLNTFSVITKKPYKFLSVQEDVAVLIKDLIKRLYDYVKHNEDHILKSTLPELIVDKFDEEQIWQQLELQNESFTNEIIQTVSQLCAKKEKLVFPLKLKCNKSKSEESNNLDSNKSEKSNDLDQKDLLDEELDSENEDYGEDDETENESADEDEELESGSKISFPKKGKLKPSVVDDKFFKLAELELFLNKEEKNEDGKENRTETFNLFEDIEETPTNYKFSDFFENPDEDPDEVNNSEIENCDDSEDEGDEVANAVSDKANSKRKRISSSKDEEDTESQNSNQTAVENTKRVRFLSSSDDEEKSEEEAKSLFGSKKEKGTKSEQMKSTFEKRKERLGQVISKLEEEALTEKPWQLKGEITATDRPQNSLLEEAVDFDVSVRPAPVITTEVAIRLEDIITQRIKDKAWDDVERKVKPVDTPSDFKKKLALDQEKSKLSLAEVYEQEFIKQREAATIDDTERQETEPPLHVEVRSMMNTLFNKLDALSNFHYTPRPVAPELKVISNAAAITMEEVAPVTVADSALLAPQEIKGKKRRGELMSKEERTETDKKRARRLKKTIQRQRQRERAKAAKNITKIDSDHENKTSKLKERKNNWDISASNVTKMKESKENMVRSSTAFFNKLQDEVKSTIKNKTSGFAKKKSKPSISAKKLKL